MPIKLSFKTICLAVLALPPAGALAQVAGDSPGVRPVLTVRDRYPDWSPDGGRVVFDSTRTGTHQIWSTGSEDERLVQLTHSDRKSRTPAYSPDGRWITFASLPEEGPQALFVMRSDGSQLRQLTNPPQDGTTTDKPIFNDSHPKWAPDGESIVFNRDVDEDNAEVFEINLDGTGLKRLTNKPDWDTYPSISPDGEYLLWRGVTPADGQSESGRNSEVFIANRDGSEPRNITNHEAFDGYPAWLPGGEGVVFASNRGGESRFDFNLYVMRPDGSRVTRLTETVPGVLQVRPSVASDGQTIAFNRDYRNGEEDEVTLIYVTHFERPIHELMEAGEEQ